MGSRCCERSNNHDRGICRGTSARPGVVQRSGRRPEFRDATRKLPQEKSAQDGSVDASVGQLGAGRTARHVRLADSLPQVPHTVFIAFGQQITRGFSAAGTAVGA